MPEPELHEPVSRRWFWIEQALFAIWILAAAVTMYPDLGRSLHLYGGFFSSYAADLTNPAWVYIVFRRKRAKAFFAIWAKTPARAAISIFFVGALSELCQLNYPAGLWHGILRGTFDPWDITAFAVGIGCCWAAEKCGSAIPVRFK